MIMKVIRASVFLAAVLLGIAAVATVSAWASAFTGTHSTGIPNDEVVWSQKAYAYWRNHTESSVELNYTSHKVEYISGDYDSVNFHAMRNKVTNANSQTYFSDIVSGVELSTVRHGMTSGNTAAEPATTNTSPHRKQMTTSWLV